MLAKQLICWIALQPMPSPPQLLGHLKFCNCSALVNTDNLRFSMQVEKAYQRSEVKTGIFSEIFTASVCLSCFQTLNITCRQSRLQGWGHAIKLRLQNSRLNYSQRNYSSLNPSLCVNNKIGVKLWWTYCCPYLPLPPLPSFLKLD